MDPQEQPQTNPEPPRYVPPTPTYEQSVPQPPQQPPTPAYVRPKEAGLHPMVVMQDGEEVVCNLKRHPFGIVSLYASAVIGMVLAAALVFFLIPSFLDQFNADNTTLLYVGFGLVVVLMVLMLGVATSVYWQNEWVVTTDSITQITQSSLFGRQVAQLSMDNLEDVTVNQDGILPHMFNFGTLKVETAGERSKFVFPYCPNPTDYARKILEVHEHFLEERRNIRNHP